MKNLTLRNITRACQGTYQVTKVSYTLEKLPALPLTAAR